MRPLLIAAAATTALIAGPAAAQTPRPSEQIQQYAPAIDRSADALLNLDLGPILDAVDPYRAHGELLMARVATRAATGIDGMSGG